MDIDLVRSFVAAAYAEGRLDAAKQALDSKERTYEESVIKRALDITLKDEEEDSDDVQ